jgi:hypothetical protein
MVEVRAEILRVGDIMDGPLQQLLGRIAHDLAEAMVYFHKTAFGVLDNNHPHSRLFEDRLQLFIVDKNFLFHGEEYKKNDPVCQSNITHVPFAMTAMDKSDNMDIQCMVPSCPYISINRWSNGKEAQ